MVHIFIINSNAGKELFSAELREHLSHRKDIDYYILHTRKGKTEGELVREILSLFEGEDLRLYSCGGSGTMCNILNGLKDISSVELAFYPKGLTNDFLKSFGSQESLFRNIDELIDGETIYVDYIRTNHGVCLNTFSIGLDSVQVEKMDQFRNTSVFGSMAPYVLGFLYAIFLSKPDEYEITMDKDTYVGKCSEVFFGNGGTIGGTLCFEREPNIIDGKGHYAIFNWHRAFAMFMPIFHLSQRNPEKLSPTRVTKGHAKKFSIRRSDGMPFRMDFDGELQPAYPEWEAQIVNRGVKLVVPKGVRPI